MAEYASSTQATKWQIPLSQVATRRAATEAASLANRSNSSGLLSLPEQETLRKAHAVRLARVAALLNFPPKVLCTAQTYFNRFFLEHSVNDFDPAAISLLAFYAAGKVEEVVVTADDLALVAARVPSFARAIPPAVLLASELPFFQALRFHLIVYHPFRSLGILREHLVKAPALCDKTGSEDKLARIVGRAEEVLVRRAYLTDLPLAHSPVVLALAGVVFALRENKNYIDEGTIFQAIEAGGGKAVPEKVRDAAGRVADALLEVTDRVDDASAKNLEEKRAAVPIVRNFVTEAFQDEEEAHQLEEVDREEAERSLQVRNKQAQLLGLADSGEGASKRSGDGIEGPMAKKVRLESG